MWGEVTHRPKKSSKVVFRWRSQSYMRISKSITFTFIFLVLFTITIALVCLWKGKGAGRADRIHFFTDIPFFCLERKFLRVVVCFFSLCLSVVSFLAERSFWHHSSHTLWSHIRHHSFRNSTLCVVRYHLNFILCVLKKTCQRDQQKARHIADLTTLRKMKSRAKVKREFARETCVFL